MVEAAEAIGGTFDFSSLNSEAGIVLTSEPGVTGGEQVNPNATEYCDGIDNDCNELIDDDAMDAVLIFEDLDGDGLVQTMLLNWSVIRQRLHITLQRNLET